MVTCENGTGQIEACRDIPVFNGKYSTSCYVDEVLRALEEMYDRRTIEESADYLRSIPAVFMHRPFRRMPETGWGMAWLHGLASGNAQALSASSTRRLWILQKRQLFAQVSRWYQSRQMVLCRWAHEL